MEFRLRRAQASDWAFIWDLRVRTMMPSIADSYGWDDATQQAYAAESLNGEIVLVDGVPAGVITLSDRGHELHLTWMAVSPALQRRGLGRALVEHGQRLARDAGKPLTLQVLRNNPALALYERCGFRAYDTNGPHRILMRWVGAR